MHMIYCLSETINGGTCIALAGKDSIILATDSRFVQGNLMIGKYLRPIHRIGSRMLLSSIGLEADSYNLAHILKNRLRNHCEKELEPENVAFAIASILHTKPKYLSTVLAGMTKCGRPCIYNFDGLGAKTFTNTFAAVGTSGNSLLGLLESHYKPNLPAEELCALTEKCLNLAFQRDILSGGDVNIVTLNKEGIYSKTVKFTDV